MKYFSNGGKQKRKKDKEDDRKEVLQMAGNDSVDYCQVNGRKKI